MTYSFTCTCGDKMSVDAVDREEGVAKMKEMMNEQAIDAHFAQKHQGQTPPTVEQSNALIEQNLAES